MEVGERYIIEISDVIATNNGNIAKIKGFNALVFDEFGLEKLESLSNGYIEYGKAEAEKSDACAEAQLTGRVMGHEEGYKEGYDEAKKVWHRTGYDEGIEAGFTKGYEDGKRDAYKEMATAKKPEAHEPRIGDIYRNKTDSAIKIIITYDPVLEGEDYTVLLPDGNYQTYGAEELNKYYEFVENRADALEPIKGALA